MNNSWKKAIVLVTLTTVSFSAFAQRRGNRGTARGNGSSGGSIIYGGPDAIAEAAHSALLPAHCTSRQRTDLQRRGRADLEQW